MLTVCIVEDSRPIRERVAKRLAELPGVSVVGTYESAETALVGLPQLKPRLTILDIGLPKLSGTAALARLVARGFEGDVIMFTVFDHDEHLFRALELGAIGYILKEDRVIGVERAVRQYQAGGAPMSASIARRILSTFRATAESPKPTGFESLTARQVGILQYVADGLLNKEIADILGLTEGTIKQQLHRIYRKLSVNNRAEAVKLYFTSS